MNIKDNKDLNKKMVEELEKEIKQCKDEARAERLKNLLNRIK